MEKLTLTLSKALDLARTLAEKLIVIEDEIVAEAKDKSFQGHDLYTMVSNKMLYYIAVENAMQESIVSFAKDYEVDEYDRLKILCRLDKRRSEKIMSMKGILSLRLDALRYKEAIQAINDYLETFEATDFRRIRKEQSLVMLKALKLI
jgi:hypothetical protein